MFDYVQRAATPEYRDNWERIYGPKWRVYRMARYLIRGVLRLFFGLGLLAVALDAHGQMATLTGTLQASNGLPAANYTIAFTPSQFGFIAGTGVVVNSTTYCATSVDGSVVGITNPLQPTINTAAYSGGTLPAGNYFVESAWVTSGGTTTLVSPESTAQLTSAGNLSVAPPVGGLPAGVTGIKVYISATSGGETLQGSVTGPGVYTQSAPLVTGATVPATNTTVCQQVANDAIWPVGTGYTVSLTDPSGNTLPGYPMQWQLLGPNTTINLTNGLPYYHGIVVFPSPILASPYNHSIQSISGPLAMMGYNLTGIGRLGVGTTLPQWAIDVEGSGVQGQVNAKGGYLVNGAAGTTGQALCSDGTALDSFCTFLNSAYYQTVAANGTVQTQRPVLNFSSRLTVSDSSSPARTTIDLDAPGTGVFTATYASTPGTSANCAQFDGAGNIVPTSSPCYGASVAQKNCLSVVCAGGSTYTTGVTYTNSSGVPVMEEVTYSSLAASECTGADSYITGFVNGLTAGSAGVFNECQGTNSMSFIVPTGATFEVVYSTFGTAPSTWTISGWLELSL